MTYQGWENYETWCVSLWFNSTPGDQDWLREQTPDLLQEVLEDLVTDCFRTRVGYTADIKGFLSMLADLLSSAVSSVDFVGICEAVHEDDLIRYRVEVCEWSPDWCFDSLEKQGEDTDVEYEKHHTNRSKGKFRARFEDKVEYFETRKEAEIFCVETYLEDQ